MPTNLIIQTPHFSVYKKFSGISLMVLKNGETFVLPLNVTVHSDLRDIKSLKPRWKFCYRSRKMEESKTLIFNQDTSNIEERWNYFLKSVYGSKIDILLFKPNLKNRVYKKDQADVELPIGIGIRENRDCFRVLVSCWEVLEVGTYRQGNESKKKALIEQAIALRKMFIESSTIYVKQTEINKPFASLEEACTWLNSVSHAKMWPPIVEETLKKLSGV